MCVRVCHVASEWCASTWRTRSRRPPCATWMPLYDGGSASIAARVLGLLPCNVITTRVCSGHASAPARSAPCTTMPVVSSATPSASSPRMSSDEAGIVMRPSVAATLRASSTRWPAGSITSSPAKGTRPDGHVAFACQESNPAGARWGHASKRRATGSVAGGGGSASSTSSEPRSIAAPRSRARRSPFDDAMRPVSLCMLGSFTGSICLGLTSGSAVGVRPYR